MPKPETRNLTPNTSSTSTKTLVVIGAGAAGFFCAVNAARLNRNLQVILLEKTSKLLSKVKVSGGGRCNVTHACFSIDEMIRNYPRGARFLRKCFYKFFTSDTIKWFADRGVNLKTEPDGRMFPVTDSSETIIRCLLSEATQLDVAIRMNTDVRTLELGDGRFRIGLANADSIDADFVCVASGGFRNTTMFDWMISKGHSIVDPLPSLFTFNVYEHRLAALMGVSIDRAMVKIAGLSFVSEGPLLITHWGFSGPAVLRLSAFAARDLAACNYDFTIRINWLPDLNDSSFRQAIAATKSEFASTKIINKHPFNLPNRLWLHFLTTCGITVEQRWADLKHTQLNQLATSLLADEYRIKGKTTFKEEFVTAGGISLTGIDPLTMQSKTVPGLYFAGEVMDVDGVTGGFNFQHAWTSGFVAAQSIADATK
jgi:predicted Rossmann fold flavoprotein